MVAIKIIRNKKRFHHQALVEVKLLDLLRRKVYNVQKRRTHREIEIYNTEILEFQIQILVYPIRTPQ